MAGRGRTKTTLSREQLQILNIKGNDCLPVNLEPPPTYPSLMTKPSNLSEDKKYLDRAQQIYEFKKYMGKQQFLHGLQENPLLAKKVANYTDDNIILQRKKNKHYFIKGLHWSQMPEELRMQTLLAHKRARKNVKDVPDIVKRLDELAAKESSLDIAADTEQKRVESDKEGEDDDELNEEPEDEEFDDDNDYGNNYFDNGESYDDNADEPMDDGPIY